MFSEFETSPEHRISHELWVTPEELNVKCDPKYRDAIDRLCWQRSTHGYARHAWSEGGRTRWESMHRMIWRLEYGRENLPDRIDHSNRDKMDNRLENLRPSTPSLNSLNSRHQRQVQRFAGVTPNRLSSINPFQATIWHRGHRIHLGVFATEQTASAAYENAREKLIQYEAALAAGQQSVFPDLGIVRRKRGRPVAEFSLERAATLYAKGGSLSAVGRVFGVDGSTIRNRFRAAGIRRRSKGRQSSREWRSSDISTQ
jgi:hypothetical protein